MKRLRLAFLVSLLVLVFTSVAPNEAWAWPVGGIEEPSGQVIMLAGKHWAAAANGNWNDSNNWNPTGVPTASDDVIIDVAGDYTVTLNVDATVNSLTLGGASGTQTLDAYTHILTLNNASTVGSNGVLYLHLGELTGSGDLTVDGTLNWTGGTSTISGAGALTVNGSITINASPNPSVSLDGRTLTLSNTGTGDWTGMGMSFKNGAVFDNQGTFDIQDASSIADSGGTGTNRFDNSGTVTKSAGAWTTIYVIFNNTNTVNVNSGTLKLSGGGTHGSSFNVSAGNTLQFGGGTHSLGDGTTFGGAGKSEIASGTVNTDGTGSGTTVNAGATLALSGGTLGGDGKLTVNGTFDWSGGTSTISGAGALTINGSITINVWPNPDVYLDGRTLTLSNTGTGVWTGTYYIRLQNGAVFDNQGTFDIQSGGSSIGHWGGTTNNRFDNSGTVTKSAGAGTTIGVIFNNTGTINANNDTLQLDGGSSHNGSTINVNGGTLQITSDSTYGGTNTLNVSSGNTLEFRGDTHTNSGIINVTGNGAIGFYGGATFNNQAGAAFDIRADGILEYLGSTAPNFNNAGTLTRSTSGGMATIDVNFNNTGTVEVQSGVLDFTRQYVQTGSITRLNGGDLSSTQTVDIQGGILEGTGTVTGTVSSAGEVSPGLSPGTLNIEEDYTQLSAGVLSIEIGGYTAGTDFDRLNITNQATLNGTLNVTLIAPFTPSAGDSFEVMTFGSRSGDFSTDNFPALAPGLWWEKRYTDNSSLFLDVVGEPGTITIVKDADPPDGTDFSFTSDIPNNNSFTLDDADPDDEDGVGDTRSMTEVDPATYTVTETVPAGWDLTGIVCVDPDEETTTNLDDATATIDLDPAEDVTCTFSNTKRGHIVVDKVTNPSADPQSFTFSTTGTGYTGFSLTDTDTPNDQELVPGDYSVSETVPNGWNLTDLSCSSDLGTSTTDTNSPPAASITLAAGDAVTCTFTDTKLSSIEVCKDVVPDDASLWDFDLSGPMPGTKDDLGDGECHTFSDLTQGDYTVTEATQAGYSNSVDCGAKGSDTDNDISFTLNPGENVTCTFTNIILAGPTGESTDSGGVSKDTYTTEEPVYGTGSGFAPDTDVDVYIVGDLAWTDGMAIPADVSSDGKNTVATDAAGDLGPANVWPPPLTPGEYDMVFDANRNGTYDAATDVVDDPNHPGFVVQAPPPPPVPVGGIIVPVNKLGLLAPWLGLAALAFLAALMAALVRRRRG